MHKGFFVIFLFSCSSLLFSQQGGKQFDINSQTSFKDKAGNQISFETFLEWTSGQGYSMEPVFHSDGSLKEILVLEPSSSDSPLSSNEFGSTPELIEQTPPAFEANDFKGQFISSENYLNKVIVLKFWFAACKPCIEEIPKLNQLVNKYSSNNDVIFLAPSLDDLSTIINCLNRYPFNYNIIPKASEIAHAYNVLGYPTHVVINRSGKVEAVFQGVNRDIDLKLSNAIESALGRKSQVVSTPIQNPSDEIPFHNIYPSQIPSNESLEVNPNSKIVDSDLKEVSFEEFVERMNSEYYDLKMIKDASGAEFIQMIKLERN